MIASQAIRSLKKPRNEQFKVKTHAIVQGRIGPGRCNRGQRRNVDRIGRSWHFFAFASYSGTHSKDCRKGTIDVIVPKQASFFRLRCGGVGGSFRAYFSHSGRVAG